MSDAPLPETLIEDAAKVLYGDVWDLLSEATRRFARTNTAVILRTALAFRDSSGRRVVWSAEAVEPLIEYAQHKPGCLRAIEVTPSTSALARYGKCTCGLDAALARVRSPEPAETPEPDGRWDEWGSKLRGEGESVGDADRNRATSAERDAAPAHLPPASPAPEIIMDARGIYWRRYTDLHLSMVPVSDDNLPVPYPYVVYHIARHEFGDPEKKMSE